MAAVAKERNTFERYCERRWKNCGRPRFNSWVGKIPWRREWQSTPVFLPGKSHGQGNLVCCSPWGRKELDMTKRLTLWVQNTYFTLEENDQEAEFKPSSDWLQRKRKLFPQIRCERKKKEQWSMELFKLKDWREQKVRSLDSLWDSLCDAQTMFLPFRPPSIVLRVDCLVAKLTLC